VLALVLGLLVAGSCRAPAMPDSGGQAEEEPPALLSAYGLFKGNGSTQEPADGVVPYDVNTPLFSDYAAKYRFVRLPPGTQAKYREPDIFDFPVGTVLVKTFAFLHDLRDPAKGRRLVETRLLIHKPEGWVGLPYIWNDQQTEATLKVVGGTRPVRWVHSDGKERSIRYVVPNVNQCMGCHENSKVMRPIGPTARSLNRRLEYPDGPDNQLAHWTKMGLLKGAPEPASAPRLPVWNDPSTGTLEQRARAYLEMNCAHCHNPAGPARTSGLDLRLAQADMAKAGVWKTPIAAGRGSGGRWYDIVPGKPDASILVYRMESRETGVMMPELGRRLADDEGLALVRAWIASLPDPRAHK
jgi:uncharacterized repeat protein (TIGR03806 family)